jgi:hypothetical protein
MAFVLDETERIDSGPRGVRVVGDDVHARASSSRARRASDRPREAP